MHKRNHFLSCALAIVLAIPAFPQTEKVTLPNGLTIFLDRNSGSESSAVHILIPGGKKAEPFQLDGLAYLTARLSLEMHDELKRQKLVELGSRLDFSIEGDYCLIALRCLSPHLEDTLEIFTDIFSSPLFSSLRINRAKQQAEHLQKTESDQDFQLMHLTLRNAWFGSPGYGGSQYGNPDSIRRIGKNEISDFYQKYFCPANWSIGVSSELDRSRITEIFSRTLARIPFGKSRSFSPQEIRVPSQTKFFLLKEKKQLMIAFSAGSTRLGPKNFAKAYLLQNLISKGMGSRLWNLREEGLAYLAEADTIHFKDAGILVVYLKTEKEKKEKAYSKLKNMLSNLYEVDCGEEELAVHKNQAKADFLRATETKTNRSFHLAFFEILGLGYSYADGVVSEIAAIGLQEFNAFKKEVLQPSQLIEVIIGPEEIKPNPD